MKGRDTVWSGGILEWPPAVSTSTLTLMYPFSAIPGVAKTVSYSCPKPAKRTSVNCTFQPQILYHLLHQ